ncbi:MAG: hypothetical protein OXU79_01640 [Gemmatimonadota bacterium]|nr:hypothetical protein [Gemmatimonadota bacterium]
MDFLDGLTGPTRFRKGRCSPSGMTVRPAGVRTLNQNGDSRARRPVSNAPVYATAIGCFAASWPDVVSSIERFFQPVPNFFPASPWAIP